MTDLARPVVSEGLDRPIEKLHRYTITSEGAQKGYFRLVEDPEGAWVTWAEVAALRVSSPGHPELTGAVTASVVWDLLEEIYQSHRDPQSHDSDWQQAEDVPCDWCVQAKDVLETLRADALTPDAGHG